MENKKNGEEPRLTISVKKSIADKFDKLKFGKESWTQMLESIYPIVAQSRKHALEKKLESLKQELSE